MGDQHNISVDPCIISKNCQVIQHILVGVEVTNPRYTLSLHPNLDHLSFIIPSSH